MFRRTFCCPMCKRTTCAEPLFVLCRACHDLLWTERTLDRRGTLTRWRFMLAFCRAADIRTLLSLVPAAPWLWKVTIAGELRKRGSAMDCAEALILFIQAGSCILLLAPFVDSSAGPTPMEFILANNKSDAFSKLNSFRVRCQWNNKCTWRVYLNQWTSLHFSPKNAIPFRGQRSTSWIVTIPFGEIRSTIVFQKRCHVVCDTWSYGRSVLCV